MKHWHKPIVSLALTLIAGLLVVLLPFTTAAAPQDGLEKPLYLPLVFKDFPQTPTPTATATGTQTATPTATNTRTPTPTGTLVTTTVPITVGVVISGNFAYSPVTVTVHSGDVVRWTWIAGDVHTVTSGTAPNANNLFCSPDNQDCPGFHFSSAGATYEHVFTTTTTITDTYFCEIHGAIMSGAIVVVP
jgi:plastocyanin